MLGAFQCSASPKSDAVFAGGVSRNFWVADQTGHGRRIHDSAPTLPEHLQDFMLHTQPDAVKIARDDSRPVLLSALRHHRLLPFKADVIERDIQTNERALQQTCDQARDQRAPDRTILV